MNFQSRHYDKTGNELNVNIDSEAGVTLIELLATVVILGVIMAPMVESYVFAWQTSIDAQRRSKAVMLANWKIEELRTTKGFTGVTDSARSECDLPAPYGTTSGDFKYECSVTVNPVDGTDPNFAAKKVSLKMYYPSVVTGNERSISCGDASSCDNSDYATYLSKLTK